MLSSTAPFKPIRSKCATVPVVLSTEQFLKHSISLNRCRAGIKWYINGMEINETSTEYKKVDDGENYRLIFGSVTTDMHGKYKCVIRNDYGWIEDECDVVVNCKPKISQTLHDVEVNEGEPLSLRIKVYAVPQPDIVWLKDGQEVRTDARVKIAHDNLRLETYDLSLHLTERGDAGVYEVKATNALGVASTKSLVTVLSKYHLERDDLSLGLMKNKRNTKTELFLGERK